MIPIDARVVCKTQLIKGVYKTCGMRVHCKGSLRATESKVLSTGWMWVCTARGSPCVALAI